MKTAASLFALFTLFAMTALARDPSPPPPPPPAELIAREVRFDGKLTENEARFAVDLDVEAIGKGDATLPLFAGEVAVLETKLPTGLRLVREGSAYRLVSSREGRYKFKLDLVAKITRVEPWNQISFTSP